jgi:hypothetical protein
MRRAPGTPAGLPELQNRQCKYRLSISLRRSNSGNYSLQLSGVNSPMCAQKCGARTGPLMGEVRAPLRKASSSRLNYERVTTLRIERNRVYIPSRFFNVVDRSTYGR